MILNVYQHEYVCSKICDEKKIEQVSKKAAYLDSVVQRVKIPVVWLGSHFWLGCQVQSI